jgi:glycosyltransferase involved in cell wall biosynthesis
MLSLDLYSVLMPLAPWEEPAIVRIALQSLFDQSLPPAQVVISCDGEPSEPLLEALRESRLPITVLIGPGHEGVGPVLARGLDACDNEVVMRADADDISLPDRARKQVEVMQRCPALAVLSTPIFEFVDEQAPLRERVVPQGQFAVSRFIYWRNPVNHPAVMLRRSKVLAAGNYVSCPGFEDYYLWLRMHARGEIIDNLSLPLVKVRIGVAHLARRRGFSSFLKEIRFLWMCGQRRLLPRRQLILLCLVRPPIRMLPQFGVKVIFNRFLRIRIRYSANVF